MGLTTTATTASEIMDRVAQLMNDPAKTDYTYTVQIPYLNMAIDEMVESLEQSNSTPTNATSPPITIPVGTNQMLETPKDLIVPVGVVVYPNNLVEIQEISERAAGSKDMFIPLQRREFLQEFPISQSLMVWNWERNIIKFNPNGASTPREVQLKYITHSAVLVVDPTTIIPVMNCRSYLSFKTAALCAMFIGENQSRAQILEAQADEAMERMTGMSNKGRQQMMTRHRPFRAGYKARGGF